MKECKVSTYEEAIDVIKEIGFLPLARLGANYPSLDSITSKEHWHTGSDLDPWLWRVKFPVDGVVAYGKFVKKKSILISRELLPVVRIVLGSKDPLRKRYKDGLVSKEALDLFSLIGGDEGIDTRMLRVSAGMKAKEKKKSFDTALLELQGSMDIVVSGSKEKSDEMGAKNGWSSISLETMEHWTKINHIKQINMDKEEAKKELKNHFEKICSPEVMKAFAKIFKF